MTSGVGSGVDSAVGGAAWGGGGLQAVTRSAASAGMSRTIHAVWGHHAPMHRLLLVVLLLAGCAPSAVVPERTADLALTECRIPGVRAAARCGTWTVPENPDQPDGRTIDLKVVVQPATDRPVASDPVFFLAGGPGQGATEVMARVPFLWDTNKHRDVVWVDMRGTGGSNKLTCPPPDPTDLAARLELDAGLEEIDDCLAALDADTTQYTTPRLVADLDAVRAALGYDVINLYGGSYGTRLGLAYIAAHEDRVRSAVLDGLAPYAMKLFLTFGEDGKAALDRVFAACVADPSCAEAFPNLEARFWPWLDGLRPADGNPPTTVTVRDPRTGHRTLDLPLDRDGVASAIRGLLYGTEMASLLPLALHQAIEGDPEALISQALILGDGMEESMAPGLMMSVACAEDVARITDADRAALASEPFLGTALLDMVIASCERWNVGTVPDSLFDPVTSDVPILLLSGAEDPVTPERWAAEAAKTLSNATSLTVPATGHIASNAGCAPEHLADFYEDPNPAMSHDFSCLQDIERPPFFVAFTGPTP